MIPLTIGTPEQFRGFRDFLRSANFTEAAICERTGTGSIFEFKGTYEGRKEGLEIRDCLDALIHLLMDGEALPDARLRALIPSDAIGLMEALGILGRREEDHELKCYSTAFVYPVAGLYIASDRATPADPKREGTLSRDVVYAAITVNTRRFLAAQPPIACENLLDLCSGSGIGALAGAARYARHAWACDITERSVHFSEFNSRLNGLDNVTSARGDLYEAVGDRMFDRIIAHPPYIPAEKQEWAFRDGGVDGEQILKRIVEGLPRHLCPDGRFYCVTLATDREEEPFEKRIRLWLGEAESEFDVILAAHHQEGVRTPPKGQRNPAIEKMMTQLRVIGTFYGTVLIRRHGGKRPAATSRVVKAGEAGSEATEWLLGFETAAAGPDFGSLLMGARLRFNPGMRMLVTHVPSNGVLAPCEFVLWSEFPFIFNGRCQQWVAIAVTWFDGSRTAGDVYRELVEQQVVNADLGTAEFEQVLHLLIANGVLELEGFPLPARPQMA